MDLQVRSIAELQTKIADAHLWYFIISVKRLWYVRKFLGVRLKYYDDNNDKFNKHLDASSPSSPSHFLQWKSSKQFGGQEKQQGHEEGEKRKLKMDKASRFGRGRRGGVEDGIRQPATRRKQSGRSLRWGRFQWKETEAVWGPIWRVKKNGGTFEDFVGTEIEMRKRGLNRSAKKGRMQKVRGSRERLSVGEKIGVREP
jgi:hypothetical protein